MKRNLLGKFKSDKGASNTVETIIMIALAVFAGLALFKYILTPVQKSADDLGGGMNGLVDTLINNEGDASKVKFGKKNGN